MFEIFDKADGLLHALATSLIMTVTLKPGKIFGPRKQKTDDPIPSDNFPHIFLT